MEYLIRLYESWVQLPRWQKWIVMVLIGLTLFGLLYYVRVIPLKEQLLTKKQKAEQLQLTVSRLKIIEKKRNQFLKKIEELNKKIAELESQLPTGKENVSQIIEAITNADSGIIIKSIKKEKEQDGKYYIAYPYSIELLGKYPNFIRWCERLSKANRIINFGDISLEAIKPKEEREDQYTVNVKLDIRAFTLKR